MTSSLAHRAAASFEDGASDQRQQHPLGGIVQAAALEQPAHLPADAEP